MISLDAHTIINLDARELATIIAALRCWQLEVNRTRISQTLVDIATNNNSLRPMRCAEIDELCARLHHS